MKKLLLALALLLAPLKSSALPSDVEDRYRNRRAVSYWGLGAGVVGGTLAVPMTTETMKFIESLRRSSNPVEACVKATVAIILLPPMIILTGATWAGAVGGTGVGLGSSLMARSTLIDAGGKVTPIPGIVGITSLSATAPLLLLGLDGEEPQLVFAGIATFAGANVMLLTQNLLNNAEYHDLRDPYLTQTGGTPSLSAMPQRSFVIPPLTISGRF